MKLARLFLVLTLLAIAGPTAHLCASSSLTFDPQTAAAFDHFYNLEFDEALKEFEKVSAAAPENPDLHNAIAQSILYREMLRNGALESEMVSGNNSFLRRSALNAPPEVEERFLNEIHRVMEIAKPRTGKDSRDTAALYSLGVSYGLLANWNFLVHKAWKEALNDATNARKLHNRITAIEPDNYDARLMQGVHDYVVGSLPLTYRMFGFLAGIHGDKEKGRQMLEEVARKGVNNRYDAEVLLCALYRREGVPQKAIPLLNDLLQRYPRNYLFLMEQAQMYSQLGEEKKSLTAVDKVIQLKESGAPGFALIPWERIYSTRGNLLFWFRDFKGALTDFQRVTRNPGEVDLNTGVLAFMRQGQIYDLTGHREEAERAYQQAMAFAPRSDAAKESKGYLGTPYTRPIVYSVSEIVEYHNEATP